MTEKHTYAQLVQMCLNRKNWTGSYYELGLGYTSDFSKALAQDFLEFFGKIPTFKE